MECILKQKVAIIEYITYNDIEEGTTLFCSMDLARTVISYLKSIYHRHQRCQGRTPLLNKVILFFFVPKGNERKMRGNPNL